ncbi:hypothetical protein CR513_05184, partial [Mucuna pruriens]
MAKKESAPVVEKLTALAISEKEMAKWKVDNATANKKGKTSAPPPPPPLPSQSKGKVVVTSRPSLPLGGLSCFMASPTTQSLWGPSFDARGFFLVSRISQHDRGFGDNSFDMMTIGGVVSALTKNEELTTSTSRALPRKCRDSGIFSVSCTIGDCTFVDVMLDLGASINVMLASIYRSLNFGDLEPTRMTIQLANRNIVQPLGVLKDVLVQVNELIFSADFYVLDMEDETSKKESTLNLGRPFLMTARTKIDVHVGTLLMEFGDTLHPTEDHFLFSIDVIEELVEEYCQASSSSGDMEALAGSTNENSCLGVAVDKIDPKEVQDPPNSEDKHSDVADLDFEVELFELLDQVYNQEHSKCTNDAKVKVAETEETPIAQLVTIFMVEIKSAREGRVKGEIKVNSAKKSNRNGHTLSEVISTNEDQTQTRVKINTPPGPDSKAAQEVKVDFDPTRTEATELS